MCLRYISIFILFFIVFSCNPKSKESNSKLFNDINPTESGIDFRNDIVEDSIVNYFTYPYIYMGGGVAIGDVNNDGLSDLFFTGNKVPNQLYLNKGSLTFDNISEEAGIEGDDRWMTGVNMVDINNDGWLDIYVSVSGKFTTTKNLLYINQGISDNGIPHFIEEAEKYGIDDAGHSTQGTFFDYDSDGDLDLYVANYPYTDFKTRNQTYKILVEEKSHEHSDHLYRNDGDKGFTDVTVESGILNFGLSLSATPGDLNDDGFTDLYISNDFASPDYMYINNGDGTFTDRLAECTSHTAFFGMGTDIADYNNDGLSDIFQLDMTPENNRRNKANMASMNIPGFWEMIGYGLGYQYMKNALQLNRGIRKNGLPIFSDIGYLTGTALTDWSWASLLVDLDRDGLKDILISNGIRRDINNKDYFHEIENLPYDQRKDLSNLELSQNIPEEKVPNYAFKNNGDLTTADVTENWGLYYNGFSNGMAYADLDNDGDLELVVSNIDDHAKLYKNLASETKKNHFIGIQFEGPAHNKRGIGTNAILYTSSGAQYLENNPTRGFQSSVDDKILFGIPENDLVDSLVIIWPDKAKEVITTPAIDAYYHVKRINASLGDEKSKQVSNTIFTKNLQLQKNINFRHQENDYNDFIKEILIPYQYSRLGPALAIADINKDGLDDFYIGGAVKQSGSLYKQLADGKFSKIDAPDIYEDRMSEDISATFFDFDNDGDEDLYVSSGGNDYAAGNHYFQDRLYENDGTGKFKKLTDGLPIMRTSSACAIPLDYDKDGDLDLFVGTRMKPQIYPLSEPSYLLENNSSGGNPKFVINTMANEYFDSLGMVTSASWNPDKNELIVVGEWMPIQIFNITKSEITKISSTDNLRYSNGWWQSVTPIHSSDGSLQYVVGNIGKNFKYQASPDESFDVYSYDFDKNGSRDIVLGFHDNNNQYPLRGKQCSSEQIPAIKYKFDNYNDFADATLEDVYTKEDLAKAKHLLAYTFGSTMLNSNDSWNTKDLPSLAQISSVNSIVPFDVNGDGLEDLILTGNLFMTEVETPRNDASIGLVLLQNEKGEFEVIDYHQSGLYAPQDIKHSGIIRTPRGHSFIAAANNDSLYVYDIKPQ